MRRSSALPLALLVVVALATAWGFASVLNDRYGEGVSYPVYSSQRSDPLGAKALYESLDRLPGIDCSRNYKKLPKLEGDTDRALLLLHVAVDSLGNGGDLNGEALKNFAAAGGRVIITIDGQAAASETILSDADKKRNENAEKRLKEALKNDKKSGKPEPDDKKAGDEKSAGDTSKESKPEDDKKKAKEKAEDEKKAKEAIYVISRSAAKVFGMSVKTGRFVLLPRGGYQLSPDQELPLKSEDLPLWYSKSSLVLDKEDAGKWHTLATVKDQISLAEYRIGKGSVVFATDSYFASNEGLWKESSPQFLSWLVGDASKVIFDETHLGTTENPGIMTLARRYRLHGMFIGGVVLFVLFVWKSSSSLLPQRDETKGGSRVVAGQGAGAALVSLLKRGLSRPQLLQKGLETWERQQATLSPAQMQRLAQARALLPQTKRLRSGVLVETYRRIAAALHPKPR